MENTSEAELEKQGFRAKNGRLVLISLLIYIPVAILVYIFWGQNTDQPSIVIIGEILIALGALAYYYVGNGPVMNRHNIGMDMQ